MIIFRMNSSFYARHTFRRIPASDAILDMPTDRLIHSTNFNRKGSR